jgi:hypothetical protein
MILLLVSPTLQLALQLLLTQLMLLLLLLLVLLLLFSLQGMNPLPAVAMAANSTLGSLYGQITHDWYIYIPNMCGVLLSECDHPSIRLLFCMTSLIVGLLVHFHVGFLQSAELMQQVGDFKGRLMQKM